MALLEYDWLFWEILFNGLGALLVTLPLWWREPKLLFLAVFCGIGIDFDHALAAGSFYIEDLTSLDGRPFVHSLLMASLLSALGILHSWRVALIALLAFLSHLARDLPTGAPLLWPFGGDIIFAPVAYPIGLLALLLSAFLLSRLPSILEKRPLGN